MKNGVSRALLGAAFLLPAFGQAQESAARAGVGAVQLHLRCSCRYDETDFDVGPVDVDGDGLTLSGSFELNDDWHIYTSYGQADLDFGIDVDTWAIGAGYVYPLKEGIDLYGRVLYIDISSDAAHRGRRGRLGLPSPNPRAYQRRVRGRRRHSIRGRHPTATSSLQAMRTLQLHRGLLGRHRNHVCRRHRRDRHQRTLLVLIASAARAASNRRARGDAALRPLGERQPQEPHAERVPHRHAMQRQRADVIDEQHAQRDGKDVEPAVRAPVPPREREQHQIGSRETRPPAGPGCLRYAAASRRAAASARR